MSEMVMLVNLTQRELISGHLEFCEPAEWQFNITACAMTTWYLMRHREDDVRFFDDYQGDWRQLEFNKVYNEYADVTERVIAEMVSDGILADHGNKRQDEGDPSIYIRDIKPRSGYFWPPLDQWAE